MSTEVRPGADPGGATATATATAAAAVTGRPRGRSFSMAVINFWLDATLLGLLAVYGGITAILRFVFPAPTAAAGWLLWGWNFDQWYDAQFNVLCAFAVGALLHVMLHWNWVCAVVAAQILKVKRPHESMQTIYGVGLLIVLLHAIAIAVIAAMYAIQRPAG